MLLSGTDERRREQVVLAYQRYGRGKAIAFPGPGLVALADARDDPGRGHDARELLAPAAALAGRRRARSRRDAHQRRSRRGRARPVTLTADVVDPTFVELNDARVVAHVDGPEGHASTCRCSGPASATASTAARSSAPDEGLVHGAASRRRAAASRSAPASTQLRAAPGDAEYFDAGDARRRGCSGSPTETGGALLQGVGRRPALPEDLRYSGRGVTTVEERELWHMPIVLLVLVGHRCARSGAIGGRWGWREGAAAGADRSRSASAVSGGEDMLICAGQSSLPCARPRGGRGSASAQIAAPAGHRRPRRRPGASASCSASGARRWSMRRRTPLRRPARSTSSTCTRSPRPTRSAITAKSTRDEIAKAFGTLRRAPAPTTRSSSC